MSYFYGITEGHKSRATRTGTRSSGIVSAANSWNMGGEVSIVYNDILKADVVTFYTTKGSNTTRSKVASFAIIDGKQQCIDTNYPELLI